MFDKVLNTPLTCLYILLMTFVERKSFKPVFTTYNTLENDVKDFYGNLDIPLVCFVV